MCVRARVFVCTYLCSYARDVKASFALTPMHSSCTHIECVCLHVTWWYLPSPCFPLRVMVVLPSTVSTTVVGVRLYSLCWYWPGTHLADISSPSHTRTSATCYTSPIPGFCILPPCLCHPVGAGPDATAALPPPHTYSPRLLRQQVTPFWGWGSRGQRAHVWGMRCGWAAAVGNHRGGPPSGSRGFTAIAVVAECNRSATRRTCCGCTTHAAFDALTCAPPQHTLPALPSRPLSPHPPPTSRNLVNRE